MIQEKIKKFFVETNQPISIEEYLIYHLRLKSRRVIKESFINKKILLNSVPVKRDAPVKNGDCIEVHSSEIYASNEITVQTNANLPLEVLFEHTDFLVINKIAGMHTHPQSPSETETALNSIVTKYPECGLSFDEKKLMEGGLVHRLDRGTSGALVCARTNKGFLELKQAWRDEGFEKIYLACVIGQFEFSGKISFFLSHSPKSKKKMITCREAADHTIEAVSSIQTIQTNKNFSVVLVRIHTGVTHQIRVTLASLGHPIIGDQLYEKTRKEESAKLLEIDNTTKERFINLRNHFPNTLDPAQQKLSQHSFYLHALWISSTRIHDLNVLSPIPSFYQGRGHF